MSGRLAVDVSTALVVETRNNVGVLEGGLDAGMARVVSSGTKGVFFGINPGGMVPQAQTPLNGSVIIRKVTTATTPFDITTAWNVDYHFGQVYNIWITDGIL
jgi:hypothetical protein